MQEEPLTRRADAAGIVIALLLFAVAGVVLWDTSRLELNAVYGLGPQAMPTVVAGMLAVLGVANLVMALRHEVPARDPGDPGAILLILGGLVSLIALMVLNGGFIPGTAILFAATASAFGRRAFVTDLLIGFGLATLIFLVFSRILTLTLPIGPIERLLS